MRRTIARASSADSTSRATIIGFIRAGSASLLSPPRDRSDTRLRASVSALPHLFPAAISVALRKFADRTTSSQSLPESVARVPLRRMRNPYYFEVPQGSPPPVHILPHPAETGFDPLQPPA